LASSISRILIILPLHLSSRMGEFIGNIGDYYRQGSTLACTSDQPLKGVGSFAPLSTDDSTTLPSHFYDQPFGFEAVGPSKVWNVGPSTTQPSIESTHASQSESLRYTLNKAFCPSCLGVIFPVFVLNHEHASSMKTYPGRYLFDLPHTTKEKLAQAVIDQCPICSILAGGLDMTRVDTETQDTDPLTTCSSVLIKDSEQSCRIVLRFMSKHSLRQVYTNLDKQGFRTELTESGPMIIQAQKGVEQLPLLRIFHLTGELPKSLVMMSSDLGSR